MLHIYTGNGKGKTTAAVGLAVRACGAGLRVAVFQFLKNGSSSEISVLRSLPGMTVETCECCNKFVFRMSEEEKSAVKKRHNEELSAAIELVRSGKADMLIMDELIGAFNMKLIDENNALLLTELAKDCEIVLTGRDPDERFIAAADYVSEIAPVRHPYEKGITARKGIEY